MMKTLIFSSDMKGGYGGKDLWIVKKKRETNGVNLNLGPVNTSADEMFFFTRWLTLLQSNGHIGMGGHDILNSS